MEVVGAGGCHLGSVPGLAYCLSPLLHTVSALIVQLCSRPNRVAAEDGSHRGVTLLLGQSAHLGLELSGEVGEAHEMTGRIIDADAEFIHQRLGFVGRFAEMLQHRPEGRACIGADHAGGRERAQCAYGFLHADSVGVGHCAGLRQCESEVSRGAGRAAGTCGECVGHVGGTVAGQAELGERCRHEFRGFAHVDAFGCGEVECAAQAAGQDVGRAQAGLAELGDAGRCLGCGIDGVGSGVDGGLTQQVHLCG